MSLVAIVDIGSTSVGAALVNTPKLGRKDKQLCSSIIFSARNEMSFPETGVTPERFLEGISTALKKTLLDLNKAGKGSPARVECFFSAPFYASQTRIIKKVEAEPFVINRALVTGLVGETPSDPEHAVLESELLGLWANGYPLNDPLNQRAKELELHYFVSFGVNHIIDQFTNTIAGAVHHRRIRFHSFAYAFYKVLRAVFPLQPNMLVLDVGGEISELSLIWHGVLRETLSFPLGRNWALRSLATKLGTTPLEVFSTIKLNLNGARPATGALANALEAAETEWLTQFRLTLNKLLESSFIPENIIAVGDPEIIPLFRGWLEQEKLSTLTLGNKALSVTLLPENIFDPLCNYDSSVRRDLSLMVETIFCDKMIEV